MAIKKPNGSASKMTASAVKPAKTGGLAAAFDNAKQAGDVPAGKYEALLVEAVLQDPNEKGQSARIAYEIATGDPAGERVTQFYQLMTADEEPGRGAAFLKRDLAILGMKDVTGMELENAMEVLTENKPGVVIQVKHKDGYQNVYLQGLAEGSDELESYRANRS